jgi:nuclear pore complex protein Nup160
LDPKKHVKINSSDYFINERDSLNAGLPLYYSHIVALYEREKHYSLVAEFARLSLQFINSKEDNNLRSDMHNRLFTAAIYTCRFETAYVTLLQFTNMVLQNRALRTLVTKMCEQSFASELVQFPFVGLHDEVDNVLAEKCSTIVDVLVGVPYHQILYAWRIKRNDFRGAAAISLSRLQTLIIGGKGDEPIDDDSLETPITQQYVALINALSCVDSTQAWILHEAPPSKGGALKNANQPKRKVVTLQDVRKEYQAELDRIAAIENNQFAFGDVDEMDVL